MTRITYSSSTPDTPRATDWRDTAACAATEVDPELFWATEREHRKVKQARAVCNRCPVRTPCLLNAYAEGDESISAGLTPRQRGAFLRKADGNVARAVADALDDIVFLLRKIYTRHARPDGHGHMIWTDTRHFIQVRGKPYTVHQLAWLALHGTKPIGSVQRACDVDGCVAVACLTDRWMRERATAARKKTAA